MRTDFVPALALYGIFVMLVLATTAMLTYRKFQHNETVFSHAQHVKNMLGKFGGSLGISVATLTLQNRTAMHYSALNTHFAARDPAYEQALHQLCDAYALAGAAKPGALATAGLTQSLAQQATLLATLDQFWIVAGIDIAGAVVMLVQRVLK